ncbi:hypothetical protein [Burkholderia pseudomallei]|uniref:hypothetical protein n=1 Tax=Burkholderia pseudomallei TaxID=28450 RepID=UPI0021F71C86|nr:hypothetical protein [Burkholderia pseudomallei]MCW0032057.1 hypothetical protein [Burkholderia pseudomallei]MCW0088621.1 hypothetical protein [Burkholderia pseudomallei]MCW0109235.1 hypothetical protein [Burkholderia pseudomallei]
MNSYEVFFRCAEMREQQRVIVDADDVRGADKALDDYCAFHDVHVTQVDAIVPYVA